ncbi:hypothetical protein ACFX43_04375 [Nocardioides sp. YIM B13467]|uniref:hypothetical protein n=1 Tax=Nocardioides sp. YIM B13467 TaxID=3366294 RepID=UPI0036725768
MAIDDATTGTCIHCHQAITWKTKTLSRHVYGPNATTGRWVDEFPEVPGMCPKARDYTHRPSADWTAPPEPPVLPDVREWIDREVSKAPSLSQEQRVALAADYESHDRRMVSSAKRKWDAIVALGFGGKS